MVSKQQNIPKGWRLVELGEFVVEISERHENKDSNGKPVLSVTNKPGFAISEEFFNRKVFSKDLANYKVIREGQFAYNPSRVNVGSIARLKERKAGLLSPMYVVFKTNDGLEGEYLDYWIQSRRFRNLVKASTQGTVRDSLNFSALEEFPFLLPPVLEQKRIISILSTIGSVISKTQAAIDQTQTLKKGLMQELFTRGIPGRHKRFKKTEIGEIPQEWEVIRLGSECNVTKLAGFEFTKYFEYKKDGEVIALRALNIKGNELDLSDIHTIDRSVSEALPRSKLYEGDVVLTYIGANIGDALRIPESNKYHLAPNIAKITPTEEFRSWFLLRVLQSDIVQRQIRLLTAITATPSLTMTQIRTIKVYKPSPTEQEEIAHVASLAIERIKKEEKVLLELRNLKSALMQVLLIGKVRVKV